MVTSGKGHEVIHGLKRRSSKMVLASTCCFDDVVTSAPRRGQLAPADAGAPVFYRDGIHFTTVTPPIFVKYYE